MKKTLSVSKGAGLRMTAEQFARSPWLTVTALCLAFSCGLTMFSTMQGVLAGAETLTLVSTAFNLLYVVAGVAAMYFLWQIRLAPAHDRCKKAAMAAMAVGLVFIVTVMFLGVFYFSVYSVLASLTPESMAEMEMAQEDLDRMWQMLPYNILSLVCTALEGAAFILFRQVLLNVGEMTRGKGVSSGIFTACSILSALAGGMVLSRTIFDAFMLGGGVQIVLTAVSGLADTGIYAGMMFLSQGTASALRGDR